VVADQSVGAVVAEAAGLPGGAVADLGDLAQVVVAELLGPGDGMDQTGVSAIMKFPRLEGLAIT
jgi:hypothetical protein